MSAVGKLSVERLDETGWCDWDRLAAEHRSGTICHRTEWLSRVGGGVQAFVVVDGGGTIRAGVALVRTTKFGVHGFHVPQPKVLSESS